MYIAGLQNAFTCKSPHKMMSYPYINCFIFISFLICRLPKRLKDSIVKGFYF